MKEKIRIQNMINKITIKVCILAIVVAWIPYYVAYAPGNVPYDGMTQLLEYFGKLPHYDHHPVFVTHLYGRIVRIGIAISDYNMGILLVTVFQGVLCLLAFGRVCNYIYNRFSSRIPLTLTTCFYAFFPVWGSYCVSVMKDTFYMSITINFIVDMCYLIERIAEDNDMNNCKRSIIIVFEMLLMSISRHESKFCLIILGIFLFWRFFHFRKQFFTIFIIWMILFFSYSVYIHSMVGIPKGEIGEALSIPFQQTARYVRDLGDNLTDEEYQKINAVLPVEELAEHYNPVLSDKIKARLRSGCSKKQYLDYAFIWFKMGLKNPKVYLAAYWDNYSGYLNPFYIAGESFFGAYIDRGQVAPEDELPISHYSVDTGLRDIIDKYVKTLRLIPILSCIFAAGFYVWAIGCLWLIYITKKKTWEKCMLIFPSLCIGICFMSAANGYFRYIITICAAMPLYIALAAKKKN